MALLLEFNDIIIWITSTSLILLATTEIINTYFGQTGFVIEKDRLKKVTYLMMILFLLTIMIKIYEIIVSR